MNKRIKLGNEKKAQVHDETDVEGVVNEEVYPVIKDVIEEWADEMPDGELKEYYYDLINDMVSELLQFAPML